MVLRNPLGERFTQRRPRPRQYVIPSSERYWKERDARAKADHDLTLPSREEPDTKPLDTFPPLRADAPVVSEEDAMEKGKQRECREAALGEMIAHTRCDASGSVSWKIERGERVIEVQTIYRTQGKHEDGRVNQDGVISLVTEQGLIVNASMDGVSQSMNPYVAVDAVVKAVDDVFIENTVTWPNAKMATIFDGAERYIRPVAEAERLEQKPEGRACAGLSCIDTKTGTMYLSAVGDSVSLGIVRRGGKDTSKIVGMTVPQNLAGEAAFMGQNQTPMQDYLKASRHTQNTVTMTIGRTQRERFNGRGKVQTLNENKKECHLKTGDQVMVFTFSDWILRHIGPYQLQHMFDRAEGNMHKMQALLDKEIADISAEERVWVLVEDGHLIEISVEQDDISYSMSGFTF